jgi:carboxypeptidase Q
MSRAVCSAAVLLGFLALPGPADSQAEDPVISAIQVEARDRSQAGMLAQTLLDSIGPRLTGSPEQRRAIDWAVARFRQWDIAARAEPYGTWRGWRRGTLHLDLIAPRSRSLDGMLAAWSPGTSGWLQGPVVRFPTVSDAAEFDAWLPQARGAFVLVSVAEPTCRPDDSWRRFAAAGTFERMQSERERARADWGANLRRAEFRTPDLLRRLEDAGALGIVTALLWPRGWGVSKIGSASTRSVPEIGLGCEDYGLLFRLAANDQGAVLRLNADAEFTGDVPVANVIAELRGTEKPGEYVLLSAHLDSWDAASGATDNGVNAVVVMEAMRILRSVYPRPRRSIIAGLWSGEEQGLHGSAAFAEDRPEVLAGMQAVLNIDNGTGRLAGISMGGFAAAGPFFRRWLSQMPEEFTREVTLDDPGRPSVGSDHAAFACHGAPAFNLLSQSWDYLTYTWHSNLDTFDKLVMDDVRENAALLAMLAYLASEDPERVPREPRVTFTNPVTGQTAPWPRCTTPARSAPEPRR